MEELGGGALHPRKIIVTRDVEAVTSCRCVARYVLCLSAGQAGEPLFVQNALAFCAVDQAAGWHQFSMPSCDVHLRQGIPCG